MARRLSICQYYEGMFISHGTNHRLKYGCSFLDATPTAELEPITESYVQADEADMGMTYDELSVFGRLRKVEKCGPYSTFTKLVHEWGSFLSPIQVCAAF